MPSTRHRVVAKAHINIATTSRANCATAVLIESEKSYRALYDFMIFIKLGQTRFDINYSCTWEDVFIRRDRVHCRYGLAKASVWATVGALKENEARVFRKHAGGLSFVGSEVIAKFL
jgi:hypothetical protein